MKTASLLSIGSELALGQVVDTNGAWVASRLAAVGVRCTRHVTVEDELAQIVDALRQAAERCDLIIVTGGLGPTEDDLTRPALAQAAGTALLTDPASIEQIRAFFAARGREMPERNKVQAQFPAGGRPIKNRCGTAPGVSVAIGGTPCYALPGVPFEMKRMLERDVLPAVRAAAEGRVVGTRMLHCIGPGESDLGEKLRDLMQRGRNPQIGTTVNLGIISVRINAVGDSTAHADSLLDAAEREIRARLGRVVFGRDEQTLASVVGDLLRERSQTLSTAESCTGGLIAKLISDVPGCSAYFRGGAVTYANELKTSVLGLADDFLARHGAVSEPVAEAMAAGARERFGSTHALSVTGIAGPAGGSDEKPVGLVYVGLASRGNCMVRSFRFGSEATRAVIRMRSALSALGFLRTRGLLAT